MAANVTITAAAQKFMRRIVRLSGQADGGFRLSVTAGGCAGLEARFSAEPAPQPGDETLVIDGLKLFLPAESRVLLDGVTVDFSDAPTASGLTFFNPAAAPCACATAGAQPPGVAKIDVGSIRLAAGRTAAR